jgi:hypothetical protein
LWKEWLFWLVREFTSASYVADLKLMKLDRKSVKTLCHSKNTSCYTLKEMLYVCLCISLV